MLYYITMATKQYSLTLEESLILEIDKLAKRKDRSRSYLVNKCIKNTLRGGRDFE